MGVMQSTMDFAQDVFSGEPSLTLEHRIASKNEAATNWEKFVFEGFDKFKTRAFMGLGVIAAYEGLARLVYSTAMFIGDKDAHVIFFSAASLFGSSLIYYGYTKLIEPFVEKNFKGYNSWKKSVARTVIFLASLYTTYHLCNIAGGYIEHMQTTGAIDRRLANVDAPVIRPISESQPYVDMQDKSITPLLPQEKLPAINPSGMEPAIEKQQPLTYEQKVYIDTIKDAFANHFGIYTGLLISTMNRLGSSINNKFKSRLLSHKLS